jgi:hypothetical protein
VISVPWIYGVRTSPITPVQAARLVDDPTGVYAEVAGLSVAEYIEWKASGGTVLCRGSTASGRPCRRPVQGGTNLEPSDWKALYDSGGYCVVHGG